MSLRGHDAPSPFGETMLPYLLTHTLRKTSTGTFYLTVPKLWSIPLGTWVDVEMSRRDTEESIRFIRPIVLRGNSGVIYVPKKLAEQYLEGSLINAIIIPKDDSDDCPAGEQDKE